MIVRDGEGVCGVFTVRIVPGRTLPVSDASGANPPRMSKPWSPYRNLTHWFTYRRHTAAQLRRDEPPNLEGDRWQRK